MDMTIGIDISQIVYTGTGVSKYMRKMIEALVTVGKKHTFVLFGASLRQKNVFSHYVETELHNSPNVRLVTVSIPPTLLHLLWNVIHIVPIEYFTGPIDVFWSSDWTQPPANKASLVTTVHDLSPFIFPKEHDSTIVNVQKIRLQRVIHDCTHIFGDSEKTLEDLKQKYHVQKESLSVLYPGI
jgi:hypothetical protein